MLAVCNGDLNSSIMNKIKIVICFRQKELHRSTLWPAFFEFDTASWNLGTSARRTLCEQVGLSVTHSMSLSIPLVCVQDYCNQPISLKPGVMIGPSNRRTVPGYEFCLTFPLDHIPHHCGIGNFRRFISISETVTGWFSRHWTKWLMPTK